MKNHYLRVTTGDISVPPVVEPVVGQYPPGIGQRRRSTWWRRSATWCRHCRYSLQIQIPSLSLSWYCQGDQVLISGTGVPWHHDDDGVGVALSARSWRNSMFACTHEAGLKEFTRSRVILRCWESSVIRGFPC